MSRFVELPVIRFISVPCSVGFTAFMNKQFSCANESAADFALSPYVNCLCCSLLPCCIAECDRRKFCCNILQSMFAF